MSLPPDSDAAIRHHEQILARDPDNAVAHYNLVLLYKRAMRFADAISAYETAIQLGIDHVEEVYLNQLVSTEDAREGVRALRERRQPVWKHK